MKSSTEELEYEVEEISQKIKKSIILKLGEKIKFSGPIQKI